MHLPTGGYLRLLSLGMQDYLADWIETCRKIKQKTTGQGKESSKKSPYGNWRLWRVIFIDNARVDEREEDG